MSSEERPVPGGNNLGVKVAQLEFEDDEGGREQGLRQFLDEKSYRPSLGAFRLKA